jgi:CRISPR-associated protein Cas5t
MKMYRIDISSWTASFRYPNLVAGFQPTLEVPPVSTVLGLINAAAGFYIPHKKLALGYHFTYQGKGVDLETFYSVGDKGVPTLKATQGIIKREFLFDNQLQLYTPDETIASYFRSPHYPLLLGRMNDLATVGSRVRPVELTLIQNAQFIIGQVVPFRGNFLAGQIQALPKYFTDAFPRNNIGTEPYSIISCQSKGQQTFLSAYRDESDPNKPVDIFMHELDFTIYEPTVAG